MKNSRRIFDLAKTGFTLIELLVVIGIISVLIAILLPSLNKARDQAATVQCLSNMRQLVLLMQQYGQENQNYIPFCTQDGTTTDSYYPQRNNETWYQYVDANMPEINPPYNTMNQTNPIRLCTGISNNPLPPNVPAGYTFTTTPLGDAEVKSICINSAISPRSDHYSPSTSPVAVPVGFRFTQISRHNTQVMLFVDNYGTGVNCFAGGYPPLDYLRFRHNGGKSINLAFLDGHAETWNYMSLHTPPTGYNPNGSGDPYCLLDGSASYLPWNITKAPR